MTEHPSAEPMPRSYRHAGRGAVPALIGERARREADALHPRQSLRRWLWAWLLDPTNGRNVQRGFDRMVAWMIGANLVVAVLEFGRVLPETAAPWLHHFDLASLVVFTLEYALRLYTAPEDPQFAAARRPRLAFARNPYAVLDLVAILPSLLHAFMPIDLRALRVFRLLRTLKLFRFLVPAFAEFRQLNQGRSLRQKAHALVFASPYGGRLHGHFDFVIAGCVLLSVIAVILESVQWVEYRFHLELVALDIAVVSVFTLELCLRLYGCVEEPGFERPLVGRLRQARSPGMVIDVLAILPFFLEAFFHYVLDLRFLRIFRLLRLLKLTRYTDATRTLAKVIGREWPVMAAAAFIMLLLVVLTASLGYVFEHDAQPDKFENIPQSIYWAVITLASVGYGDITPVTPAGRAVTIVLALIGIGIFAIPAALLSSAFSDQLHKERDALRQELFDMLADGVLSEEEAEIVNREARRLHLSAEDVDVLMQEAKRAREMAADLSKLPLHIIAADPAHAIEHFKSLVCDIRKLGLMTDRAQFVDTARAAGRLTDEEWRAWVCICGAAGLPESPDAAAGAGRPFVGGAAAGPRPA
ncbi:ion transporter [Pseudacidovorax sp. RU35E]|uniref:ion transporter n=1 Tax=Pseudacidovorax sp. RU35E TaxID=1907403 RepID=UPI0009563344|nr:ion transporter [Pseudacidovorax sp. RU35E]SIQ48415.1 Ion transport protein [Pseudacidovorax sp. RU35E]